MKDNQRKRVSECEKIKKILRKGEMKERER